MKKILLSSMLLGLFVQVNAQKNKEETKVIIKGRDGEKHHTEIQTEIIDGKTPGKKIMRVEKNIDGKVTITEKEINETDSLNDQDYIEEFDDSYLPRGRNRTRVYRFDGNEFGKDFNRELDIQMDNLHRSLKQLPIIIKGNRPLLYDDYLDKNNTGIRNLDVFSNKPDEHVLNIRFFASAEGDVKINVIDLAGKSVGKSEAAAFKGEYMGQIVLEKGLKGTFFIIVSQNEDGVTKKLRIGALENVK